MELQESSGQRNVELEKLLASAIEERNLARDNMLEFNDQEEELYQKLCESDRIQQEQHNWLMQLIGNI
jgi:hypothetical protein